MKAFCKYVFDSLLGSDIRFQVGETEFVDDCFEQETVAKYFTGFIRFMDMDFFGTRKPSKTNPSDIMDKVYDVLYRQVHNTMLSTLGEDECLSPWIAESWVGKTDTELRNLLAGATAQINQDGTKRCHALLSVFLLIIKHWVGVNRPALLAHFRSLKVDRTWMRRQIIKGKFTRKKVKGKTIEQWQDDPTLTVSDIIWLSNKEKQDIQSMLGVSWVKAFDDALFRFSQRPTTEQHDLYKDMLAKFEQIRSEQTDFVRVVSAKSGKRKSMLIDMGLLGDVKKKNAYTEAIAFISKPPRERLIRGAGGAVDDDATEKFNQLGDIDNFIHLLPFDLEDRENNLLENAIMPNGFFQGKYYQSNVLADLARVRITRVVRALVEDADDPVRETEIPVQNMYQVLVGNLPAVDAESGSSGGEEDDEAPGRPPGD